MVVAIFVKAFTLMVGQSPKKDILSMFVHLENAFASIRFTVDGIVISFKLVHPKKAFEYICFTPSFILIFSNIAKFENA